MLGAPDPMGRKMFKGLAEESPKDGEDADVVSRDLDGARGKPVCVPACLEFCVVRSLLGAFVGNMQNERRVSLIYC